MSVVEELLTANEAKMKKVTAHLKEDLASLRAGRATPALLNKVTVDYYGTPTPVNQVANVTVPEPRMIVITPWDKSMIKDLSRAIMASDLGLTPNSDGTCIRLNMPMLTEERRKELVKTARKHTEEARVSVRNMRRDIIDGIKKRKSQNDYGGRRQGWPGQGPKIDGQTHEGHRFHHRSQRKGNHVRLTAVVPPGTPGRCDLSTLVGGSCRLA